MIYNQILSDGKRILNIQYFNVDRLYSYSMTKILISENGHPLSDSEYYKLLPRFYVIAACLTNMGIGSVVEMLSDLNKLGFDSLKKECKVFSRFLKTNS